MKRITIELPFETDEQKTKAEGFIDFVVRGLWEEHFPEEPADSEISVHERTYQKTPRPGI